MLPEYTKPFTLMILNRMYAFTSFTSNSNTYKIYSFIEIKSKPTLSGTLRIILHSFNTIHLRPHEVTIIFLYILLYK